MATSVSSVQILLRARDEASRVIGGMSAHSQRAFGMMGRASEALVRKLKFLAAAGFAALGYAMTRLVKDSIRYGIQMDKLRKETGLSTEKLAGLRYAMEQEHGSTEALEKGLMNLTVRIGYAGDGLASYIRYFDALGISYKKTDGTLRNTYDVFMDVVGVMSQGEMTTEKMAAAMQLFGTRAAKDLIPFLKLGGKEIERLSNEGLGLLGITQEDTDAMKRFDNELFKVKTGLRGVGIHIAKELLPYLERLASWMADNLPKMKDYFHVFADAARLAARAITRFAIAGLELERMGLVLKRSRQRFHELREEIMAHTAPMKKHRDEAAKNAEIHRKAVASINKDIKSLDRSGMNLLSLLDSLGKKHEEAGNKADKQREKTKDLADEIEDARDVSEKMTKELIGAFPFIPPAMGMRSPAIRKELPAGREGGTPISLYFNVTNRKEIYAKLDREFDRLGV